MTSLLTRIESGQGADRALDGELWCVANGHEFVTWDGAGCAYRDHAVKWDNGFRHVDASRIPALTSSVDAALSLVERMLPGQEIELAITRAGTKCTVLVEQRPGAAWLGYKGANKTPARAVVAALLRVLDKESSP